MTAPLDIRALEPDDRDRWAELFRAYRDFYRLPADESVVERVWDWTQDPAHETSALVALADGRIVGIAHWRLFARPAAGGSGLWLDDLFTDPDVRGRGVGRALIARLQDIAAEHGCSIVRWITAEDNAAARRLYDDVTGGPTSWVTYDAPPATA